MTRGPKKGSGESAARVLKVLQSLGTEDGVRPRSILTPELCARAKIDAGNLSRIMAPLVEAGQVLVCKVTVPGARGGPKNEYRLATGGAVPPFRPLDTRRAGVALGQPGKPLPATTPAPKVSTPKPGINEIEPAALGKPQRDGGPKPPAAGGTGTPNPAEPAVAAVPATPAPASGVALKKEPTARPASAGDALRLSIDEAGTLLIATDEGVIELQPTQARRLGHFMAGSHGIWNPF